MDTFRTPTFGVLLVSGLIAGLLGYAMSRRSVEAERVTGPRMVMMKAREMGDTEVAKAGREFLSQKFVPEMKPVLLDLLKEAEDYMHGYFRKAEKSIKSM